MLIADFHNVFRAFDLPEDTFRISYYCANEWLPMLSDWDLDAAVISASDPCLQLALLEASNRDNKINLIADEDKKSNIPYLFDYALTNGFCSR